ncbi:MAG: hypothetical protein HW416_3849 [Chloroflexi bacterium]|nr:hypothetical protein [Chloroflexota bacterium]
MQPVRNRGCVPVIAVDDIWRPTKSVDDLQGGPTEVHESIGVVRKAVNRIAAEESSALDQVNRHFADKCRCESRFGIGARYRERPPIEPPAQRRLGLDLPVAGHDNPDVMPHRMKRLRQRARNVGEASDLGEGSNLSRYEENPQTTPLA